MAINKINAASLQDGTVVASEIASNAVTTAKINADAVTAAKIADNAISEEHLDVTAITGHTAETTVNDSDLVVIHDASASALRKMTVANLTANAGVTGISSSADATAITIDSNEQVGIGAAPDAWTTSYSTKALNLGDIGSLAALAVSTGDRRFEIGNNVYWGTDNNRKFRTTGAKASFIQQVEGRFVFFNTTSTGTADNNATFSQRMNIGNTNGVGVGSDPDGSVAQVGIELGYDGYILNTRNNDVPMFVNRLGNDGTLVSLRQDTTEEGTISVYGGTVSYNGFTGTHWSRFQDNSTPTILKGTVLESLDEMCDWYNLHFNTTNEEGKTIPQVIPHVLEDGQSNGDKITYNYKGTDYEATIVKETDIKHMKSKVSDTVDAKNVYGVFSSYDNDGEGYNDFHVASVGSFVVRIKQGETIAKGDLLQSNGDGTAKVQSDDNLKSSSFAKVLSTTKIETYGDGSFIVPCSLRC